MACKRSAVRSRLPPPTAQKSHDNQSRLERLFLFVLAVSSLGRVWPSCERACMACKRSGLAPADLHQQRRNHMIIKVALSGFYYLCWRFLRSGEYGQAVSALAWHARGQRLAPANLHQQRRNHMIIKVALSGFFYLCWRFLRSGEYGQAVGALAWHARGRG